MLRRSGTVSTSSAESRIRLFMLGLSGVAMATTLAELWLENHTQEPLQLVPWVLCVVGIAAVVAAMLRTGRQTLLALRGVMAVVALGGLIGIGVHLLENVRFQQDIHPYAALTDFLMSALKGAAPLLAPGALTFAALLALAATYAHPALNESRQQAREVVHES